MFYSLNFPQEIEDLLVVARGFRREDCLYGLYSLNRVLQVEYIPSFAPVVNLLGQQTCHYIFTIRICELVTTVRLDSCLGLYPLDLVIYEAFIYAICYVAVEVVLIDFVLLLIEFVLKIVKDVLDEVSFAMQKEILHRLEVQTQVELIEQYHDEFLVGELVHGVEPGLELRRENALGVVRFGLQDLLGVDEGHIQDVVIATMVPQEVDSLADTEDHLRSLFSDHRRDILSHHGELIAPLIALVDLLVFADEELIFAIYQFSLIGPVVDVME